MLLVSGNVRMSGTYNVCVQTTMIFFLFSTLSSPDGQSLWTLHNLILTIKCQPNTLLRVCPFANVLCFSLFHTHTHTYIECVCYLLYCTSIVSEKILQNRLFAICIIRAYTYLYIIYYDSDDNKKKLSSSSVAYSSWSRSHRKIPYNTIHYSRHFIITVRNKYLYVLCLICDMDAIFF